MAVNVLHKAMGRWAGGQADRQRGSAPSDRAARGLGVTHARLSQECGFSGGEGADSVLRRGTGVSEGVETRTRQRQQRLGGVGARGPSAGMGAHRGTQPAPRVRRPPARPASGPGRVPGPPCWVVRVLRAPQPAQARRWSRGGRFPVGAVLPAPLTRRAGAELTNGRCACLTRALRHLRGGGVCFQERQEGLHHRQVHREEIRKEETRG